MRKKTSKIWTMPKEELEKYVKESKFFSELLIKMKINKYGAARKYVAERMDQDGIAYSHFKENYKNMQKSLGSRVFEKTIPLSDILVENSNYSRGHLKERLIKDGILENRCSECGLSEIWNGKEIKMQLDHRNGKSNDNRLPNLRLLCPNCHSQTDNFSGKKNRTKVKKTATEIHAIRVANGKRFGQKIRKVKDRPDLQTILDNVKDLGYCGTGRLYGVSDNAIRKWIKFAS